MFVNGRMIAAALPWDALETVIKMELNRPSDATAAKAEKCCEMTMPTVDRH
jgi:hypothetical protein